MKYNESIKPNTENTMKSEEINREDIPKKYWYVVKNLYKSCCYDRRSVILREKLWDGTIDGLISVTKKYNGMGHVPGFIYFCCQRRWLNHSKKSIWDFEHEKIFYLFSNGRGTQDLDGGKERNEIYDKSKKQSEIYEDKEFLEIKLKLINKKDRSIFLSWLNGETKKDIAKRLKKHVSIITRIINKCIGKIKKSEGLVE